MDFNKYIKEFEKKNYKLNLKNSKYYQEIFEKHGTEFNYRGFFRTIEEHPEFVLFVFYKEKIKSLEKTFNYYNNQIKEQEKYQDIKYIPYRGLIYELNKEFKEVILALTFYESIKNNKINNGEIKFEHHNYLRTGPKIQIKRNSSQEIFFARFTYLFSDIERHLSEFIYNTDVYRDIEFSDRAETLKEISERNKNISLNTKIPKINKEKMYKDLDNKRKNDNEKHKIKFINSRFHGSPSFKELFENIELSKNCSLSENYFIELFSDCYKYYNFQELIIEWMVNLFQNETKLIF